MQLDSVRDLKAALTASVLAPLSAAGASRGLAMAAQPLTGASTGMHRTIALGIVRKSSSDFKLAVRLQRREMESSPQMDLIRKRAKDEVDVRYVGRIFKRATPWHQKRNRPLRVGGSVGHFKITAGTLGCFVKSRSDGTVMMLSNNHVLANENDAKAGDAILQPGALDGGQRPRDVAGALADFVKLKAAGVNRVDCATATIKKGIKYRHKPLTGLGNLAGLGPDFLDEGTGVAKVGRTTGTTRGKVTAFELDNVMVRYDVGVCRFDGQVEVESTGDDPFSLGGDSGSLIVDDERKAVALLFAGSEQGGSNGMGLTFCNPIRAVLDALKVDLLY